MAESISADESSPPHHRLGRSLARQACDACRGRKVRCDTSNSGLHHSAQTRLSPSAPYGGQCRRCARLKLSCTFLLPSRVRGPRKKDKSIPETETSRLDIPSPPEQVAAGAQVSRSPRYVSPTSTELGEPVLPPVGQQLLPNGGEVVLSPITSLQWSLSPQSILNHFSTESALSQTYPTDGICTRDVLKRILSDYLKFLYPLIPVVHRPSFHQGLRRHRDVEDNDFLGLILALCAAVVGTMPSKFREYRSLSTPIRFQTRKEMMNYCYDMLIGLRGPSYFDEINFQKWAASYCMAISFFQIGEHNRARMVEVESMQLARLLNLHQISEYDGLNCIETQLRKKGFWLLFYGYVHSQLQNLRRERLTFLDATILNSINLEDLMPLEVDDEMILEDRVVAQPTTRPCLSTGFIVHSRTFWAALTNPKPRRSSSGAEDPCLCIRSREPVAQISHLKGRLHDLKYMLDDIPLQLRQWAPVVDDDASYGSSPEQQRIVRAQFASMRANIHVTHLWLQSIILDQLDALLQSQSVSATLDSSQPDPKAMWIEREDICRQLLHVLHSIPQVLLEPNGLHLTFKVRDVAVALLTCPFEPREQASKRASEYVREFTDILSCLDGSESASTVSLQSWVDTDRIRGKQGTDGFEHSMWLSWG